MSIENKKKLRVLCLVLFILYSISIVYFLIFSDMFGRGHGYEEMRYNLTPFLEIKRFVKLYDEHKRDVESGWKCSCFCTIWNVDPLGQR